MIIYQPELCTFINTHAELARTIRAVFKTDIKIFTLNAQAQIKYDNQVISYIDIPACDGSETILEHLNGDGAIDNYLFKEDTQTLLCVSKPLLPNTILHYLIVISLKEIYITGYDIFLHAYKSKQELITDRITYYSDPKIDLNCLNFLNSLINNQVYYTYKLYTMGYLPFAKQTDSHVIIKPFLKIFRVYVKKTKPPIKKSIFVYNRHKGNNLYFIDQETKIEHCLVSKDELDLILHNIDKGRLCLEKYYKITLESDRYIPEYTFDFNNIHFSGMINAEICSDSESDI